MKYKKILVPYDGSDHAGNALETAYDLLRDSNDCTLHILTVLMAPSLASKSGVNHPLMTANTPVALMDMDDYAAVIDQALEDERAKIREKVSAALEEFGDRIVVEAAANLYIVDGINDYVVENDIEMVIMGRRGLGALRGMLGSVSYGILRTVEVPVLTVK